MRVIYVALVVYFVCSCVSCSTVRTTQQVIVTPECSDLGLAGVWEPSKGQQLADTYPEKIIVKGPDARGLYELSFAPKGSSKELRYCWFVAERIPTQPDYYLVEATSAIYRKEAQRNSQARDLLYLKCNGKQLEGVWISAEKLQKLLERNSTEIPFKRYGNDLLITAGTTELSEILRSHFDELTGESGPTYVKSKGKS